MERSGPVHRLGAKLSKIQAGLTSLQKKLEEGSPNVTQAKLTQKVRGGVEASSRSISLIDLEGCGKMF